MLIRCGLELVGNASSDQVAIAAAGNQVVGTKANGTCGFVADVGDAGVQLGALGQVVGVNQRVGLAVAIADAGAADAVLAVGSLDQASCTDRRGQANGPFVVGVLVFNLLVLVHRESLDHLEVIAGTQAVFADIVVCSGLRHGNLGEDCASLQRAIGIGGGQQVGIAILGGCLQGSAFGDASVVVSQSQAAKARRNVGEGIVATARIAAGNDGSGLHAVAVVEGTASNRVVGAGEIKASGLQAASQHGTEAAGQADEGLAGLAAGVAGNGGGIAHAGVLIRGDVVFEGEQRLEPVAEVFNALEAQAGRGIQAVVDNILSGFARGAEVSVANVDHTIDGDVGLGESAASGKAGNSNCGDFLEHVRSPIHLIERLVISKWREFKGAVLSVVRGLVICPQFAAASGFLRVMCCALTTSLALVMARRCTGVAGEDACRC